MPDNPSYPNYPSYQQPALEPDELDEATLDRVIGGLDSPKELQETQMSFPLVYPQIQNGMQGENRSYTAVSKIMTAKHDSVKNPISNIR